jgi:tight adherence protein C
MDPIWLIAGGAGLAGLVIVAVAFKLLGGSSRSRLDEGPRKVAAPGTPGQTASVKIAPGKERELQKVMTDRILRPLAGLLMASGGPQSRLVEKLVHAGIRKKGAAEVFMGAKVAIALALPAATAAFMLWRADAADADVNVRHVVIYCAMAMTIGLMLPNVWLNRKARARMEKIKFALPDALDLLVVCIESGLALDAAFVRLARELHSTAPELSEELSLMNLEVSAGKPREDCLRNLGLRTGVEEAMSLAARIIQTTKFGTNLAQSLRIHAESLRQKRRQEAEERAAKTTVKLLFPLVFFIFPAIFVVILGPALVKLMIHFGN